MLAFSIGYNYAVTKKIKEGWEYGNLFIYFKDIIALFIMTNSM